METPRVTICLPNLNTRPFLPERFNSILRQYFVDWELIVYDSYSDDGSWEYIQDVARTDPRIRAWQGPREGIYPAWNRCIEQALGEFIYIATSDDTMTPDFLATMVAALDAHPECGIAHCCLTFIDAAGEPVRNGELWEQWPAVAFYGDLIRQEHVRPAGYDAVIAAALLTPYYSITQILVRREVFDRAGFFQGKWGSFGDLEWQLRATLVAATVHVPRYLATWRKHAGQATSLEGLNRAMSAGWFVDIVKQAVKFSTETKGVCTVELPKRLERFAGLLQCEHGFVSQLGRASRLLFLTKRLTSEPLTVLRFLMTRASARRPIIQTFPRAICLELERIGLSQPILSMKTSEHCVEPI